MAVFLVDGGIFVGRFEKQKYKKGKNFWWWLKRHQAGEFPTKEYKEATHKFFTRELNHIKFKIESMELPIDSIIVCYDGIFGRRNRGQLYPDYKRHKSGIKATKHKGIDIRKMILECDYDPMKLDESWSGLYDDWKEADDLIAETALQLKSDGIDVVVFSEDKDMYQLLDEEQKIRIHNLREEITRDYFKEIWGIKPKEYVDWKCLVGDVSDNIKGLPGIGEVKAKKLLAQWKTLENIPKEVLVTYYPKEIEKIVALMQDYREVNDLKVGVCRAKFGNYWSLLESKKKLNPISFKDANKLFKAIPEIQPHFRKEDYSEKVIVWKKIIQLPFEISKEVGLHLDR